MMMSEVEDVLLLLEVEDLFLLLSKMLLLLVLEIEDGFFLGLLLGIIFR